MTTPLAVIAVSLAAVLLAAADDPGAPMERDDFRMAAPLSIGEVAGAETVARGGRLELTLGVHLDDASIKRALIGVDEKIGLHAAARALFDRSGGDPRRP